MSRRGRILLVVLAVLAVPAWFAWREAARWQHLRAFIALSEALDADLAEYESAVRRRPPRGAPFEAGPAEVHYRRAIDLEIEGGLDEAMSRRAMEEIAAGTRTASAGVLRSPREGPAPGDPRAGVTALTHRLEADANAARAAGDEARALDRVEELIRFGIDRCVGDLHSARDSPPLLAGLRLAQDMAEEGPLSPEGAARAFRAVSEFATLDPPAAQAWFRGSLETQVALRGVLFGSISYEDLRAGDRELWPERGTRVFGLFGVGPNETDFLEAWRDLRGAVGTLRAAVASGDEAREAEAMALLSATARSEAGSFQAGILAQVIVSGALAVELLEGRKREAEGAGIPVGGRSPPLPSRLGEAQTRGRGGRGVRPPLPCSPLRHGEGPGVRPPSPPPPELG